MTFLALLQKAIRIADVLSLLHRTCVKAVGALLVRQGHKLVCILLLEQTPLLINGRPLSATLPAPYNAATHCLWQALLNRHVL